MNRLAIVPAELAPLLEQELASLERKLKEARRAGNHKKARRIIKQLDKLNDDLDRC